LLERVTFVDLDLVSAYPGGGFAGFLDGSAVYGVSIGPAWSNRASGPGLNVGAFAGGGIGTFLSLPPEGCSGPAMGGGLSIILGVRRLYGVWEITGTLEGAVGVAPVWSDCVL
jgi:hypothetical protein